MSDKHTEFEDLLGIFKETYNNTFINNKFFNGILYIDPEQLMYGDKLDGLKQTELYKLAHDKIREESKQGQIIRYSPDR